MPRVDLLNGGEVRHALKGARWVFHLAYGSSGHDASRVTIEGTRNVVEGAIAERCECVVILSSIYVFGQPDAATVDESWPYDPVGGEYGRSKARMERWCLERSTSSGFTRIIVLNPSCVYGPGGRTYSELPVRLAKQGAFCWVDGGKGTANYTFVENLLDAMLLAARLEVAHGQRFIVTDGYVSWREFLEPLLGRFGEDLPSFTRRELAALNRKARRTRLLRVVRDIALDPRLTYVARNAPVLGGALKLVDRYAPATVGAARAWRGHATARMRETRNENPPPVWLSDVFCAGTSRYSAEKACRVLGWSPRIGLDRGRQLTLAWLRDTVIPESEEES